MEQKRISPKNIDYEKFVQTYNIHGKQAALEYITETYGVTYGCIVKRLKKYTDYVYSHRGDRYVKKAELDSTFLSVEELCTSKVEKTVAPKPVDYGVIILNLIKDRFFEISKFVVLEQSSKKIFLDAEAAKEAGYDIEYT